MIDAIYFGIFFVIIGLWTAAMIGDDYDNVPIWIRFFVALSFIGGIMSLGIGLIILVISHVN